MGRPLFSSRPIQNREPVIRVEPEAEPHPTYGTWSYWNAFDPDSDEFFERDAVYEAFVDPAQLPETRAEEGAAEGETRSLTPLSISTISDASDSSSESTSGRSTPVDMSDNRYTRLGLEVRRAERSRTRSPRRSSVHHAPRMVRESSENNLFRGTTLIFSPRLESPVEGSPVATDENVSPPVMPPARTPSPHLIVDDAVLTTSPLHLPVTLSAPLPQITPSFDTLSRPSLGPQLHNRATPIRRNAHYGSSGPLPNHGARMSVAHITPVMSHVVG